MSINSLRTKRVFNLLAFVAVTITVLLLASRFGLKSQHEHAQCLCYDDNRRAYSAGAVRADPSQPKRAQVCESSEGTCAWQPMSN